MTMIPKANLNDFLQVFQPILDELLDYTAATKGKEIRRLEDIVSRVLTGTPLELAKKIISREGAIELSGLVPKFEESDPFGLAYRVDVAAIDRVSEASGFNRGTLHQACSIGLSELRVLFETNDDELDANSGVVKSILRL